MDPEDKVTCLCRKCEKIPYLGIICRGWVPTALGFLILIASMIAIFILGTHFNELYNDKERYLDTINQDSSCSAYCGSQYIIGSDTATCCLYNDPTACSTKSQCETNTIDTYESGMLACRLGFLAGLVFLIVYVWYYLLRCIFVIRKCLGLNGRDPQMERLVDAINEAILEARRARMPEVGAVDRLPSSFSNSEDKEECSICYESYEVPHNRAIRLSCGHIFHSSCLRLWMQDHINCPYCNAQY